MAKRKAKAAGYTRYPAASRVVYNGLTITHYLLGGAGILLGYRISWIGYALSALYLAFAFGQMYVWMPLQVCPHCVYTRLKDGLCISGLNGIARRLARPGDARRFARRAKGLLCPNNLYLAAKVLPIVALIPALILDFSFLVLGILVALVGLLLFRILVIFPRVACKHCLARSVCPNARAMGLAGR